MLNMPSGAGLRMALESPERIDALLAERAAQPVADRLHVLAGEEKLARAADTMRPVPPSACCGAAPALQFRSSSTCRSRRCRCIATCSTWCTSACWCMEPTLAAMRDTLRLLALPHGTGQAQRAVVVLNRVGIAGGLTRRQIEEALKMKVDVAIPDLPRQVGNAATMGEPAVMASSGGFRNGIVELARQVGFIGMPDSAPATQPPPRADRKSRAVGWRFWAAVMSAHFPVRRRIRPAPAGAGPTPGPSPALAGARYQRADAGSGLSPTPIAELRSLCLARLEPAAVAAMPAERLTIDVERLVSEIATERRIQLNAREQHALAGELVHDILGLGPLEPLLEDDGITDIMVNGPDTDLHRTPAAR